MRKIHLAAATLVAAALSASAATAQMPRVTTGAELVSACTIALDANSSADDRIARASCNQFLAGLVAGVYASVDKGAPMVARRLGSNLDEEVCFRLPDTLSYESFAKQVTDFAPEHPELYDRPAFEMGARTLAANYPCPE